MSSTVLDWGSGCALLNRSASAGGKISLLVTDRSDRILGVCLRQLVRGQDPELNDQFGLPAGVVDAVEAYSAEPQRAASLLATVVIDKNVSVTALFSASRQPRDPISEARALGQRVWKLGDATERPARVTGIYATLRLIHPAEPPAKLFDAIEIEPEDFDCFAGEGDMGSLIISDDGAPVGILVAGAGELYIAVPVADWMKERGYKPLTNARALRHNLAQLSVIFRPPNINQRLGAFRKSMAEPAAILVDDSRAKRLIAAAFAAHTSLFGTDWGGGA